MRREEDIRERLKDLKELREFKIKAGESTWETSVKIQMLLWILND
jgi:hypothetical protein